MKKPFIAREKGKMSAQRTHFKRRYQRVRVTKHAHGQRGPNGTGLRGLGRVRKTMEEVTRSKRGPKWASVSA